MSQPARRTPLAATAWGLLLFAGALASLQMVHAGNLVAFQHYHPFQVLIESTPPWASAIVVLELAMVMRFRGLWWPALRAVAGTMRGWRLPVALLAVVLTSATLSRDPRVYGVELLLATLIQLMHLAVAIAFGASLPAGVLQRSGARAERLLEWNEPDPAPGATAPRLDRFALMLALGVAVVASLLALLSYQAHPHVPDEVAYLLQARFLAAGHLTVPAPPVPEAFETFLMMEDRGRWFSAMPSGWSFLLAIGSRLGMPWIVNPLLAGANILLTYLLVQEFAARRVARLTTVLLACSPWHLFLAMSFMSHTASLTAALGAAVMVGHLRRTPHWSWAALAGVGIGLVALNRPLEGVAVALLLGFWSLGARGTRFRYAPSAVLTLATGLTSALTLVYNRALTGSAREFPVMRYFDAVYGPGRNALGFGPSRGLGWPGLDPLPGHGVADVLINANFNLFQINVELLGWAVGSVTLVVVALFARRLTRADWQMLLAIVLIAGVHSFYFFSGGPDFGARYWFLTIVPLLVLVARAIEALAQSSPPAVPADIGRRVLLSTGLLLAVTVLVFVPWRAADKYRHYRGMRPDVRALAGRPELQGALVLVRGKRHPDYASAVAYNPVSLDAPEPVFAWDRGGDVRQKLVDAFPARRYWIVDGPTITSGGYRVIAGPLSAAELLARGDTLQMEPPDPAPAAGDSGTAQRR